MTHLGGEQREVSRNVQLTNITIDRTRRTMGQTSIQGLRDSFAGTKTSQSVANKIVKAAREEMTPTKKATSFREKGSPGKQSPSPAKEAVVESPHGQLIREAYFQHISR